MDRLEQVSKTAEKSLLAQAMTFEGDAAGQWLIDVMRESPAKDKRLLVDSYSKVVVNDHFIFSGHYLKDRDFRNEVRNTKALLATAQSAGIQVKFTNPVGWIGQKYPLRNHKKMVIVDGKISFLGGINFSDHNFEWHDMMVELADEHLGANMVDDYFKTWQGINQSGSIKTNEGQLYLFNGSRSEQLYAEFFEHIRNARKSVQVISPYISEPLLGVLRSVAAYGVKITIVSPQVNNKSIFRHIILSEQKKGYFQLKEYPGMSHMKAILIDDNKLIFGSSNYDLVSYFFEQEVVFVSEDLTLIEDFKTKVLAFVEEGDIVKDFSKWGTWKASFIMNILEQLGRVASRTILRPH